MIRFGRFLTEMARPMIRDGVTYSTSKGMYFKDENNGMGKVPIDYEEYMKAKDGGKVVHSRNTAVASKTKDPKVEKFIATETMVSKLEKPKEYTLFLFDNKLDEFKKKVAKVNKLLSACGNQTITPEYKKVKMFLSEIYENWDAGNVFDMDDRLVEVNKIDFTIKYQEITAKSGYTFIGSIKKDVAGSVKIYNRYNNNSLDKKLELFRHRNHCDDCGKTIARNATFIFREDSTGQLVQIGSKCLKKYIPLEIPSFINLCEFLENPKIMFGGDIDEEGIRNAKAWYSVKDVLETACAIVRMDGFVSSSAGDDSTKMKLLAEYGLGTGKDRGIRTTKEDSDKADTIIKWIKKYRPKKTETNYIYNLQDILANEYCVDTSFGMIASAVQTYDKNVREEIKKEAKKASGGGEFVGNVGDKKVPLHLTVTEIKTIEGFYKNKIMYKFVDKNGNIIVFFATTGSLHGIKVGDVVDATATIKEHKVNEYTNENETIVMRLALDKNDVSENKKEWIKEVFKITNEMSKNPLYEELTDNSFYDPYDETKIYTKESVKEMAKVLRDYGKKILSYKGKLEDIEVKFATTRDINKLEKILKFGYTARKTTDDTVGTELWLIYNTAYYNGNKSAYDRFMNDNEVYDTIEDVIELFIKVNVKKVKNMLKACIEDRDNSPIESARNRYNKIFGRYTEKEIEDILSMDNI